MARSSYVSSSDKILASQYNNLRDDVLSLTYSHRHSGNTDDGRPVQALQYGSASSRPVGADAPAGSVYLATDKRRLDIAFAGGTWTNGPRIGSPTVEKFAMAVENANFPGYTNSGMTYLQFLDFYQIGTMQNSGDVILLIPHYTNNTEVNFISGILQAAKGTSASAPLVYQWYISIARSYGTPQYSIMPIGGAVPGLIEIVTFDYSGYRFIGVAPNNNLLGFTFSFSGNYLNTLNALLPQFLTSSEISNKTVQWARLQISSAISIASNGYVGINVPTSSSITHNLHVEGTAYFSGPVNGYSLDEQLPTIGGHVTILSDEQSINDTSWKELGFSRIHLKGREADAKLGGYFKSTSDFAEIQLYNITWGTPVTTYTVGNSGGEWSAFLSGQFTLPPGLCQFCLKARGSGTIYFRNVYIVQV